MDIINEQHLTFRHIHVLKKLLLDTFKDNYSINQQYAANIVQNIDETLEPEKKRQAEELLAKIVRLSQVPLPMRALINNHKDFPRQ